MEINMPKVILGCPEHSTPIIDFYDPHKLWVTIKCVNHICTKYDKYYFKNSSYYRNLSSNSLILIAVSQWNKDVSTL